MSMQKKGIGNAIGKTIDGESGAKSGTRSGALRQDFRRTPAAVAAATAALVLLSACGDGSDGPGVNTVPSGATQLSRVAYRATTPGSGSTAATQDLLTAGLGKSGIASTSAVPAYADPLNPTAEELRRNAILSNYRGLVDNTAGGGYGVLYGPNIDLAGANTRGEGLVPGLEVLGVQDDSAGRKRVAMAVQIPDNFDVNAPCLVVGPSSGSRGVYGAISSAGEWGLKRGCAVALTDAGKGMGLYDPTDDTVHRIDGTRATRAAAGSLAHFAADLSDAVRTAFNTAFPNRLALKHAHSQLNPEKDWGNDTLAAARFGLYALNQEYGEVDGSNRRVKFNAGNTTIIAASVSNGGAAVLRAAEQDADGLIDGVVAFEPSAQPGTTAGYGVQFGGVAVPGYGKPLIDYFTVANLYQPCAALASAAVMAEVSTFNFIPASSPQANNRCAALAAKGLVTGATTADQAANALARLRAYGWSTSNDQMHNAHFGLGNAMIISSMYVNAYGRFSVADNICNVSFASVVAGTGVVQPVPAAAKAQSYAVGNGTSNGSPATPVLNTSVGGAKAWQQAVSPSTGTADFALDAALCQRALVTGNDTVTGAALTAATTPTKAQSDAVRAGMAEVLLNGNLRGKPVLMVGGRSDALIPVNNSERAYVAYNRLVEGGASQLRYVEVTNAQHFDSFNPFAGFDNRFVPLHAYFTQAMNAMYARVKSGTALPGSQVVRTTPRGGVPGAAPAISAGNVPGISGAPAAGDQIGFVGNSVNVPE